MQIFQSNPNKPQPQSSKTLENGITEYLVDTDSGLVRLQFWENEIQLIEQGEPRSYGKPAYRLFIDGTLIEPTCSLLTDIPKDYSPGDRVLIALSIQKICFDSSVTVNCISDGSATTLVAQFRAKYDPQIGFVERPEESLRLPARMSGKEGETALE